MFIDSDSEAPTRPHIRPPLSSGYDAGYADLHVFLAAECWQYADESDDTATRRAASGLLDHPDSGAPGRELLDSIGYEAVEAMVGANPSVHEVADWIRDYNHGWWTAAIACSREGCS